jgi:hypothetical protein
MRRFVPSFFATYLILGGLLLWSGAPVFTIGVLGAGMTVAALAPEYR